MTRPNGFLHWVLPAMLGLAALTVLLSGRDLALMFSELQSGEAGYRHPIVVWAQRGVSLLVIAACGERIVSHFMQHQQLPSPILAWSFVIYWLASVAAPAMFGAHPHLSHEYLYTLLIGFAYMLTTVRDRDMLLDASRTALMLFMLLGVLLIPIFPAMVLDANYKEGLLPGVPRLGGVATHPVALGMFAQTALLLLLARPFERRWVNRFAWVLGLSVLVMAQSKTAWIAFVLCGGCMIAVRHGPSLWRRLGDPTQGAFGIMVCLSVMAGAVGVLAVFLLTNPEAQWIDFLDTAQGAQLMSMSGRDRIWAVALEEWQANPVFGYGPNLWDDAFRASIGMPNAINAHNQFMDTLARSGTVGAVALVLYASVLLVLSVRHARATGGLSLALFLGLALLSISEVPIMLFAYGTEPFGHLLLLAVLPSAGAMAAKVMPVRARPVYGTAS